jgi:formylglycine-generating enzyme required for sulfatase activity
LFAVACLELIGLRASAVEIDWVTIGDPGNPPDDEITNLRFCVGGESGFGSVDSTYRISRTEITNAQYAEFLNAVAKSDPNGLYDVRLDEVNRIGADGSYSYSVDPGFENRPIAAIGYYDALRFANWLHNGQPIGAQSDATTEDGAYALHGSNPFPVARNPDAKFFLPTEDQWYKAAYYDPVTQGYFDFATASDVPPIPDLPPVGEANYACCLTGVGCSPDTAPCEPTDVGSYPLSASSYGTLDQSGNLSEWTEDLFEPEVDPDPNLSCNFTHAMVRGGLWSRGQNDLASFTRVPSALDVCCGATLRVAAIPAPEPDATLGAVVALALLPLIRAATDRGRLARRAVPGVGSTAA